MERRPGPVEEFYFLLEELRCKAESAVLRNKPDRWDYYLEMVERLTEWFSGVDRTTAATLPQPSPYLKRRELNVQSWPGVKRCDYGRLGSTRVGSSARREL